MVLIFNKYPGKYSIKIAPLISLLGAIESMTVGTNILIHDTDGDGLSDGGEVLTPLIFGYSFILDPFNSDQDGNGILDGKEDWDGDGLDNEHEITIGCDVDNADSDGDGLSDGFEAFNDVGDCWIIDSDSDSITDYDEVCYYENLNNLNCDLTDPNVYDPFNYTSGTGTDTVGWMPDTDLDGGSTYFNLPVICTSGNHNDGQDADPLDPNVC